MYRIPTNKKRRVELKNRKEIWKAKKKERERKHVKPRNIFLNVQPCYYTVVTNNYKLKYMKISNSP